METSRILVAEAYKDQNALGHKPKGVAGDSGIFGVLEILFRGLKKEVYGLYRL